MATGNANGHPTPLGTVTEAEWNRNYIMLINFRSKRTGSPGNSRRQDAELFLDRSLGITHKHMTTSESNGLRKGDGWAAVAEVPYQINEMQQGSLISRRNQNRVNCFLAIAC